MVFVGADLVTTAAALELGGREANPLPAELMRVHPSLWVMGLLGILVMALMAGRVLNRKYKNGVGALVLPVPVLIEIAVVLNNVRVIRSLAG